MALLTLSEVHKSYGYQDVLRGVSFFVSEGKRTGLVGPNGAGKSTILRIILGAAPSSSAAAGAEEAPDQGHATLQPNTRVGLLAQEPLIGDARTVLEAAQRPTAALQEAWSAMRVLEESAFQSDGAAHEEALQQYDEANHRYQDLGGYDCENRAKEVLAGLGFLADSWEKPVQVLSGGERTRLALAQILVDQPDLLLLDEPTNHVDWEACEWLQTYLRRYPGSALIVSHDRYFLDETAEEIVELERGRTRTYQGNYSAYVKKKAFEREQAETEFQRKQEEIVRQQAILQRFRSHRNFSGMHSREKVLERLQDDLGERPRADQRKLKVRVGNAAPSGREAVIASDIAHSFGERVLFSGINLTLERGQRLALIGPNGAGKSTLLKIIAGKLAPTHGAVTYGYRAQPGYFAQDLSTLDPDATVWDTLWDTGALDQQQAMQALHQFMFMADDLEKHVSDLSGGERTRLALCLLLATKPNLLLLDEPTNHLDLASREAVERALRGFPGGVIVVSHDRYFLEAVATRILVLRGSAHRVFDGGYRRYREAYPAAPPPPPTPKKAAARAPAVVNKPRTESPSKRLPKVEKAIAATEARLAVVTAHIGDANAWARPDYAELNEEFEALNATLEALYVEWEEVATAAV